MSEDTGDTGEDDEDRRGPDLSMHDLGEGGLTLAVAAVIPVLLGQRLNLDPQVMNAHAAQAMTIVFAARDGDPDAQAFVVECMERLQTGVRRIA